MLRPASAEYVDGVKLLHAQFAKAALEAFNYASKYLQLPPAELKRDPKERIYKVFFDFKSGESQLEHSLAGHFVFGKYICRFLPIKMDYALAFPVRDHSGWDEADNRKGLILGQLEDLILKKGTVIFYFAPKKDSRVNYPLYKAYLKTSKDSLTPLFKATDDLGNIVASFPDIEFLKLLDLPSEFTDREYSLVGKQFYAPYSTDKEAYCVLYAQLDNQYDTNAIQVLRWLPEKKGTEGDQLLGIAPNGGDVFFELGHISRTENADLHSFMVENESRLLFGKIADNKIKIMGGVKFFQTNDLKYPRCLYHIEVK